MQLYVCYISLLGYFRKNPNKGVEDMESPEVLPVEIPGFNGKRSGISRTRGGAKKKLWNLQLSWILLVFDLEISKGCHTIL